MPSKLLLWLLLLLLGACSKGPQADLQYIKQARSIAAEWALVNQMSREGKLTATYASSMHKWLRKQLKSSAAALSQPNSAYGREITAISSEPENAPPEELRVHSEKLKQIEDALESA
jgi:hypothetical protein